MCRRIHLHALPRIWASLWRWMLGVTLRSPKNESTHKAVESRGRTGLLKHSRIVNLSGIRGSNFQLVIRIFFSCHRLNHQVIVTWPDLDCWTSSPMCDFLKIDGSVRQSWVGGGSFFFCTSAMGRRRVCFAFCNFPNSYKWNFQFQKPCTPIRDLKKVNMVISLSPLSQFQ